MHQHLYPRLSFLIFMQYFIPGSYFVTMGTYFMKSLHFTGAQVGLAFGAQAIAAMLSPFVVGVIADRYFSVERILAVLYVLSGLLLIWCTFIEQYSLFYPVFLFHMLAFTPSFALSNSICFHHIRNNQKNFPRIRVWGTIGWIAAGLLVGFLAIEDTYIPLRIAAGASIAHGLYALSLPYTPPLNRTARFTVREILGLNTLAYLKHKAFLVLIVCLSFITIPVAFYYAFTNPFLNEIGMTNAAGKMTLGQMFEIGILLLLPWFFTRLGVRWMIFIGLFAWGIRHVFFAFGDIGPAGWMLYVGILLHGVAFNFTSLTAQIHVDDLVPRSMRSSAQGLITLVTMGLGRLVGTIIAGGVVTLYVLPDGTHDWRSIWLVPGIFGVVIAIAFLAFYPKGK